MASLVGACHEGWELEQLERVIGSTGFEGWDQGFSVTGQLVIHRAFVMLSLRPIIREIPCYII